MASVVLESKFNVWAVFIGPRSNRKIHVLFSEESDAIAWASKYSKEHDRQTPAEVALVPVY